MKTASRIAESIMNSIRRHINAMWTSLSPLDSVSFVVGRLPAVDGRLPDVVAESVVVIVAAVVVVSAVVGPVL